MNNPSPQEIEQARQDLSDTIDQLFKKYKDADAGQRCKVAGELVERYYEKVKELPPCVLLDRLAGFILAADKSKRHKHRTNYAVLSRRQQKARHEREVNINTIPNADKKKHNIQILQQGKEKYYPDTF